MQANYNSHQGVVVHANCRTHFFVASERAVKPRCIINQRTPKEKIEPTFRVWNGFSCSCESLKGRSWATNLLYFQDDYDWEERFVMVWCLKQIWLCTCSVSCPCTPVIHVLLHVASHSLCLKSLQCCETLNSEFALHAGIFDGASSGSDLSNQSVSDIFTRLKRQQEIPACKADGADLNLSEETWREEILASSKYLNALLPRQGVVWSQKSKSGTRLRTHTGSEPPPPLLRKHYFSRDQQFVDVALDKPHMMRKSLFFQSPNPIIWNVFAVNGSAKHQ